MAEGWLRQLAGDRAEAASAGTQPVGVNPSAIEAMRESGVDLRGHRSRHVSEFLDQRFDYVITVCDHARQTCPVWPGAGKMLHWSLDVPAGKSMDEFRRVRDEIEKCVGEFAADFAGQG